MAAAVLNLVAPRFVNEGSCVKRGNAECYFSWQAQDCEVEALLFVAGAALGEIWNDSPSAKCCIFQ